MAIPDRQEKILAYLMGNNTASVHRLAREGYASEATIRRDLVFFTPITLRAAG